MTYAVELTRPAEKDILGLDDDAYSRVARAITGLQDNPRPTGARKLRSQRYAWRLRVGDYRVLYEVDEQRHTVTVYRVRHRREVYRER